MELLCRLNELKNQLCEEERKHHKSIMPYHIFTGNVLEEIAKKKPTTKQALAFIEGLPKTKIDKYGDRIIEVVDEFEIRKPT